MSIPSLFAILVVAFAVAGPVGAQQKAAPEEARTPDLIKELIEQPDGVLLVRSNEDGTFKSLVVKWSVELDAVLGELKGRKLARAEAEAKCKRALAKWLNESCVFSESASQTTTIVTKGESAKDAAGNVVKLREQKGTETKISSETSAMYADAAVRGLIVLASQVTEDQEPEYILIMGLSQDTIGQAGAVAKELKNGPATEPGGVKPPATETRPAAEKKANPAASGF